MISDQARGREDSARGTGGTSTTASQTAKGGGDEESNTGGLRDAVVIHNVCHCGEYPYIFKARHQCYVRMTCNTPTPGHPSAADDAWYLQKRVLRIG